MTAHNRRLKTITFQLDSTEFQCQVNSWTLTNNSPDGEKQYTYCTDGEFREEVDDDWALDLRFFSDWRSTGVSDFLWDNDKETVTFQIDHHPDVTGEHVRWTGSLVVRAPSVGGDVRTTEVTEVTLQIVGTPTYARIG